MNHSTNSLVLLKQANRYLTLGIDELFREGLASDHYNFLMIFQNLLDQLERAFSSHTITDAFMEKLYQAESLGRLAANHLFLESLCGDKANYLGILRNLIIEIREQLEAMQISETSTLA
jgi:hypothetical protein